MSGDNILYQAGKLSNPAIQLLNLNIGFRYFEKFKWENYYRKCISQLTPHYVEWHCCDARGAYFCEI